MRTPNILRRHFPQFQIHLILDPLRPQAEPSPLSSFLFEKLLHYYVRFVCTTAPVTDWHLAALSHVGHVVPEHVTPRHIAPGHVVPGVQV